MTLLLVILLGLIIGSFLNVCIYRVPRGQPYTYSDEEYDKFEGIVSPAPSFNDPPRSHCPHCKNQLLWWHNIPVLSWFLLRGRCAFCKAPISARYPAVELLTGLLAALCYQRVGLDLTGILLFLFCAALLVITFIDYDYFIIPDVISLPGSAIGVLIAVINAVSPSPPIGEPFVATLFESFLGLLCGGGFLWLVSTVYLKLRKREGLGMGDVKLLFMVGTAFGPACALYTIFLGSLVGSVLGITLILFTSRTADQHIPFGPYLTIGTMLYLFVPPTLLEVIFPL